MKEIATLFFKLGCFGFGGPLAIVAILEEEVCRKRNWLSTERFGELYAVCKLFPGPVSSQMAIAVGRIRGGTRGGILAGILFLLPAFLLMLVLSALYAHFGARIIESHLALSIFQGVQAATLGVILFSVWSLLKPHVRKTVTWAVALPAASVVFLAPRAEPLVILGAGILGYLLNPDRNNNTPPPAVMPDRKNHTLNSFSLIPVVWASSQLGQIGTKSLLSALFWSSFKAGAFVFGTGIAIVPLLEADVVGVHQWLTHHEFMDGLALGQITPGPIAISVTFIGYQVAGFLGSLVSTLGIFLPSFINMLLILPLLQERLSRSKRAAHFASFALAAVIGSVAAVSIRLGHESLVTAGSYYIFAFTIAALLKFRLPSWVMIPMGALLGLVF